MQRSLLDFFGVACPKCESRDVYPHTKGTFEPAGFTCLNNECMVKKADGLLYCFVFKNG